MRQTKYMASSGLAFSEGFDMKRLAKKSSKGWHLQNFGFLGYMLERGKPASVEYELDYNEQPDAGYFQLFEDAGWEHVCSGGGAHIFRALAGTAKIYSKKADKQEVYRQEKKKFGSQAIFCLIIFAVLAASLWAVTAFYPDVTVLTISLTVLLMIWIFPTVFTTFPYLGYTYKVYRLNK